MHCDIRVHNSDDGEMGLMLLCLRSLNMNVDDCYMPNAGNSNDG